MLSSFVVVSKLAAILTALLNWSFSSLVCSTDHVKIEVAILALKRAQISIPTSYLSAVVQLGISVLHVARATAGKL